MSSLQAIGYGPFSLVKNSDHRPIFLDFDTEKLFGDSVDLLTPLPSRGVKSSDRNSTTKYIEVLYDKLQSQGVFNVQKLIDNDTASISDIEYVDQMLGTLSTEAEKQCEKRRPEFYSTTIVKQRVTISILRSHMSA